MGGRVLVVVNFDNGLGNTAAFRTGKVAARRPDYRRTARRADQERPPPDALGDIAKRLYCRFGQFGEEYGEQANTDGAGPDQQATKPETQISGTPASRLAPMRDQVADKIERSRFSRRLVCLRCGDRPRSPV